MEVRGGGDRGDLGQVLGLTLGGGGCERVKQTNFRHASRSVKKKWRFPLKQLTKVVHRALSQRQIVIHEWAK